MLFHLLASDNMLFGFDQESKIVSSRSNPRGDVQRAREGARKSRAAPCAEVRSQEKIGCSNEVVGRKIEADIKGLRGGA